MRCVWWECDGSVWGVWEKCVGEVCGVCGGSV